MFKENDMVYMVKERQNEYYIQTGLFNNIDNLNVIEAFSESGKAIYGYHSSCFKTFKLAEQHVKSLIQDKINSKMEEVKELKNKLNNKIVIIN